MVGSRYGALVKSRNISYNTHTMFIIDCYKCLNTFRSYYTYFFELRNRVGMVVRWGLNGLIFRRTRGRYRKGGFANSTFDVRSFLVVIFARKTSQKRVNQKRSFQEPAGLPSSMPWSYVSVTGLIFYWLRYFSIGSLFIWKTFFFLSYLECFEWDSHICKKVASIIIRLVNWTIVNRVEWNLSKCIFTETPDKKMLLYPLMCF